MEERNDDNKNYSTPDKTSLSSQKDSAKSSSSQQESPANNRKLPYQRSPSSPSPISFDLSSITNKSQYATLIAKAKQNQERLKKQQRQIEIVEEPDEDKDTVFPQQNAPTLNFAQTPNPKSSYSIMNNNINSSTFNFSSASPSDKTDTPTSEKQSPGPNFIRARHKGSLNNTMKLRGTLAILKHQTPLGDIHISNAPSTSSSTTTTTNTYSSNTYNPRNPKTTLNFQHSSTSPQPRPVIESSKTLACYSIKKSTSVIEYSYKEDQNRKFKEAMEDKGKSIDNFTNDPNQSLFCLYDGHGGEHVSRALQMHFDSIYKKKLELYQNDIESALKAAYKDMDNKIKSMELISTGSTACVVHVVKSSNYSCKVYCSNIGDTRCSLISPVKIKRLSYDHKASDQNEKLRIINSGGNVMNDRVMGQLMLTRAFGDFELKEFGVKSEPYISQTTVDLDEKNQFLILACDGIWDVLSEDDIKHIIMFGGKSSEELCKSIMKNALLKEAWDNLSLFVIKLS